MSEQQSNLKRVHLYISGRVQGVTFRASTRRKARKADVNGWVKNLPDGRVEAVLEGPPEAVDDVLEFCHEGPRMARVESVEVQEEEPTGEFDSFQVQY